MAGRIERCHGNGGVHFVIREIRVVIGGIGDSLRGVVSAEGVGFRWMVCLENHGWQGEIMDVTETAGLILLSVRSVL